MTSTAGVQTDQLGETELSDQLRDCLGAVIAARGQQPDKPVWRQPETERLQRFLAAAQFEDSFYALLTFAQQQHPTLRVEELTAEFLARSDEGKILRRASVEYAHAHRIEPRRARHLLLLSVNLHHYGQRILRQLQDGLISIDAAELAASKLTSIPEPHPKKQANGQPWSGTDYEDARERAERAKRDLGEQLADVAKSATSEGDFKAKAGRLRDEHHPEPAHLRHRRAARRRYLRSRPAADGMAHLDAYLPAAEVVQIIRTVKVIAARHRSDGLAKNRSEQQLLADVAIDLLLGARGLTGAPTEPATTRTESASKPQLRAEQNHRPLFPIQPTLFLTVTLTEWVNLGGYLDTERMGYLKTHYPQLYDQAERNRKHFSTPAGQRAGPHPDGVLESGAWVHAVGSDEQLDTATSAQLTAQATMLGLLLLDPATGYPIGTGRRVRRVTTQVAELVSLRDQTCRYPGCRQPAVDCELDHVQEFAAGGHTSYANTVRLCRSHHGGKSAGWWEVLPAPERGDGALRFTDPATGKHQYSQPPLPLDPKAWRRYQAELDAANPPPF